ncbi:hypothetical protein RSAG8_13866, partial [Rhizoctonia solani AG-8 WAC10335]
MRLGYNIPEGGYNIPEGETVMNRFEFKLAFTQHKISQKCSSFWVNSP